MKHVNTLKEKKNGTYRRASLKYLKYIRDSTILFGKKIFEKEIL